MKDQDSDEISASPCPNCYVCGAAGKTLYSGLRDRLFNAPGEWSLKKCPNTDCGLVWLDPMPSEKAITLAYRDYYTHQDPEGISATRTRRAYASIQEGYLAQRYGYFRGSAPAWKKLLGMLLYLHPGRREDVDFHVMYLPAAPQDHLLEIGCGGGKLLTGMKQMGWKVEGVDFDDAAVENARSKGLRVQRGTVKDQAYPNDHFEVIFMSHLLEHVHDPGPLLQEVHRILKPGGRLILITPNIESLGHRIFQEAWRGLEVPRHLHIFTMKALRNLAEKAGFTVKQARVTVRNARGAYLASRSIQKAARAGKEKASIQEPNIQAELWQFMEWIISRVKPGLGEELLLFAGKEI
ncbi:MAG: class I SAM-dependent methyltransferase [Thermodesulfobacteriota bacterium]